MCMLWGMHRDSLSVQVRVCAFLSPPRVSLSPPFLPRPISRRKDDSSRAGTADSAAPSGYCRCKRRYPDDDDMQFPELSGDPSLWGRDSQPGPSMPMMETGLESGMGRRVDAHMESTRQAQAQAHGRSTSTVTVSDGREAGREKPSIPSAMDQPGS
ncbi:hypothetical protein OF83DRAFT_74616 [Amylostereum chailletii]|nr:hypothetical protein OF83DRAFT_74616 [Amylostereum chailletii]